MKMKTFFNQVIAGGLLIVFLVSPMSAGVPRVRPASAMHSETIDWIKKVADWQLAQSNWNTSRTWHWGALYAGMMAAYEATKDEEYLNKSRQWAQGYNWRMDSDSRHADNQACTQAYLEMYLLDQQDPYRYQHFKYVADLMVNDPYHFYCNVSSGSNYWWWCDALFMAPPSFARLSRITGDPRYIDTMHWMWEETQTCLYDTGQHLFFRDITYFDDIIGGQEVFWSRGNGWVVAGTVRVLQYLPQDAPLRSRYETLLQEMASKLAQIQMPDGYWYSNLLYPQQFNVPETSGTGFFCYGIAWGINNGLLDAAAYGPVVEKAWNALKAAVHEDGKLGWVQPTGVGPAMSYYDSTPEVYGIGAYLLAGSEMNKYFRSQDPNQVDDFESCKSTDTFSPTLRSVWHDGTVNGTGARIALGDYGDNLLELEYDNTTAPYTSRVDRHFSPVKDWTGTNAGFLSVLVQGFAANTPDGFYVEIEDEDGTVAIQRITDFDLQSGVWNELAFPLSGFSGVDLTRVKYLRLGAGPANPSAPGTGAGLLRIDNIRLSPTVCNLSPQADFSGDCRVNLADFAILAGQWMEQYFTPLVPTDPGTGNLAAHWPLDGNYDDVTGNGFNAISGGNPLFVDPGHSGQSVYFNSASYLDCQNSAAMHLTGGASISAWIKSSGLKHQYASVVTKGLTAWRLIRNSWSSAMSFHFNAAGTGEFQANGQTAVLDNQWHHLVGVYDGSQVRLYVDGQLDAYGAAGAVKTSTDPVYIGSRVNRVSDRSWEGQIDDVRIYNRALTEAEIFHLAEAVPAVENPRPTDLVTDGLIDHLDLNAFLQSWYADSFWP
jgi:rhamnogalacturonyl hydrolase YesR